MGKNIFDLIVLILLYVGLIISVYTDIRYGKIKNYVTFPLIIIGLIYNLCSFGLVGIFDFLLSVFLIFIITIIFAFSGGIGMGDVKLFIAIAAIKGQLFGLYSILLSCLLSAIAYLIINPKKIKTFFLKLKSLITYIILNHKIPKATEKEKEETGGPLALYIFLSVVILQIGGIV